MTNQNLKMNKKLILADNFLKEGWEELKKYEASKNELFLQEACEKGWGAVAKALKVMSPDIRRHSDFGKTARKLAEEYNNEEIFRTEAVGEYLHRTGFYEGAVGIEEVKHGLLAVEDFLKLMDNILMNGKKEVKK
jgi:hypothetical protein